MKSCSVIISFLFTILSSLASAQVQPDKIVFIDTHNDILSNQMITGADLAKEQPETNFDLPKAKRGNLAAQVFSVWCDEVYGNGKAYAMANSEIDSLYALIKRNPGKIQLVKNAAQLATTLRQQKLAALIGVEGGHMIEGRMDYIDSLFYRGMRYLTLTWNNSTTWATSARDEVTKKDSLPFIGLTAYGKQIVEHLNQLGVMIDVSHVGEKTFYDVLATTKKPVIASHSCAYALNPHRRNLKDAQLLALKKNGGVVFINFYSGFLDSSYDKQHNEFLELHKKEVDSLTILFKDADLGIIHLFHMYQAETDKFRPPLSMLIKHINYIVKLIGADHVGIGSDFDGAESFPMQMNDVSDYPLIVTELKKIGYSIADIKKITSENFIRVLKANEKKM
ncbi:MAG: membrane dipeptidase [Chitinophagaceae bacterium]|nr:membrane dipeptidase [Chitinophagaceae bacterium]